MKLRGLDTVCDPALRKKVDTLFPGQLYTERNGLPGKTRTYVATSGLGPSHNNGLFNASVNVAERAMVERSFLCKKGERFDPAVKPRRHAFTSTALREFRDNVAAEMPHLPRLTLEQVVESYSGPKRKRYEAARVSLQADDLTAKDASLAMFVKKEKGDVGKAPRVILPRSSRYNLVLGQYLKHAEHPYFEAINRVYGAHTPASRIVAMSFCEPRSWTRVLSS